MSEDKNTLEWLNHIIEDAERRLGSYLATGNIAGDVYKDSYVRKQIAVITNAYEIMNKLFDTGGGE